MARSHGNAITWQTHILPHATKKALSFLSEQNWLKKSEWYLAGGTALALQAGHRQSVDLDFFHPKGKFSKEKLLGHFSKNEWVADIVREGTIYGKLLKAKVSFIAYPFFVPKEPFHYYGSVPVLDAKDIATMKIIAISQRGRKRDFVDLYWYLMNREPLLEILHRLHPQYPTIAHNYHHILKALKYFEDAEDDPMPEIFFKANWKSIKIFLKNEVTKASKELLDLD